MTPAQRIGRSILVVEDEPSIRGALCRVLSLDGWEAQAASNGQEALDLLRQGYRPSAMLLDHDMPFMTGSELLAILREDRAWAAIPVICMSGNDWPGAVSSFLPKPFEPKTLFNLLTLVMGPDVG